MPGSPSAPQPAGAIPAIEQRMAADGIEFIRFEQTDTHGISRSKTIPVRHFRSFAESGLNFLLGQLGFDVQGGVAPATGYLEDLGFPDSRILPDLSTYAALPWADKTARVLCEPHFQDGRPALAAPRTVARRALAELETLGYRLYSGFEYEFYLVDAATRQPPFPGIQIFATLRNNFDEALVYQILRDMTALGVDIITANAEYGPGQMEINFAPAHDIVAADHAFTFKNGLKEIAQRNGMMASFMTKPYADQSANGCHFHHGLIDVATGSNAFRTPDGSPQLTDLGRWWLGGLIAHTSALVAFAAPTVNCGKRYKLFSFAPTNATWGDENRTVGFRMKGLGGASAHIENRLPWRRLEPLPGHGQHRGRRHRRHPQSHRAATRSGRHRLRDGGRAEPADPARVGPGRAGTGCHAARRAGRGIHQALPGGETPRDRQGARRHPHVRCGGFRRPRRRLGAERVFRVLIANSHKPSFSLECKSCLPHDEQPARRHRRIASRSRRRKQACVWYASSTRTTAA